MIQFDIGFKVDAKSLEGQLNTIHKEIQNAFKVDTGFSGGMSKEISNAVVQARSLEKALSAATTDKGLSFSSMNAELRRAGTNMNQVVSGLIAGGDAFKGSANEALAAFASANRQVITLNKHLQEMGRVFLQSMKFTVAQQAIQGLQNMLQESYEWVVDLDSQLTQIQIVSGKTAQQMEAVSAQIVERSRALRVAASDYAEASQIYYQQGLQDAEVQRRADITIKAAQAANESTKAMSDMLTAVWNTYNMQGEQLENAASVGAKLGAETAIEFRDIAEAMQISATAASQMGVSYNSLASIIATVGSTTRQSASVIGNAYKTIFNNFQRLKVDGENGEVTLKAASQQLQALGIQLLDTSGQVKDLDEVIMQAGQNWKNYSENEQLAIAQLVGGTRQFGQFLALMNNFDYYLQNLNSANMETGAETLEEQYSIAMESIEAKATNAAEAWQRAFSNFYDTDGIKDLIDLIADLGNMTNDAVEAFGGLDGVIQILISLGLTQLSKNIDRVRGSVTDFMDSLSPKRRANRINKDVEEMFRTQSQSLEGRRTSITDVTSAAGKAALRNVNLEIDALNKKKSATLEAAKAQDQLNSVIAKGSAADAAKAQGLQEEIKARQQNTLALLDEAEALRKRNDQLIQSLQDTTGSKISNLQQAYNLSNIPEKNQREEMKKRVTSITQELNNIPGLDKINAQFLQLSDNLDNTDLSTSDLRKTFQQLVSSTIEEIKKLQNEFKAFQNFEDAFSNIVSNSQMTKQQLEALQSAARTLGIDISGLIAPFNEAFNNGQQKVDLTETQVEELSNALDQARIRVVNLGNSFDQVTTSELNKNSFSRASNAQSQRLNNLDLKSSLAEVNKLMLNFSKSALKGLDSAANLAAGVSMLSMSFSTLKNAVDEGNMNIMTFITVLSTAIPGIQMTVTSMQSLVTLMGGPATIAFMAIIAAVGALIIKITEYNKILESQTGEARVNRMKDSVNQLSTAFEQVNSKAETLLSTLDEFQNANNTLQGLIANTEEWKNQITLTNESALNLINAINDLGLLNPEGVKISGLDYFERGEYGWQLKEGADLEGLRQEAEKQSSTAQLARQLIQVQATVDSSQEEVRSFGTTLENATDAWGNTTGNILALMAAGTTTGAAIGAGIGGTVSFGTLAIPAAAVGAVAGTVVAGGSLLIDGLLDEAHEKEIVNYIEENYATLASLPLEELKQTIDNVVGLDEDELNLQIYKELQSAMQNRVAQEKNINKAYHDYVESIIDTQLSEKYNEAERALITNDLTEAIKDTKDAYIEKARAISSNEDDQTFDAEREAIIKAIQKRYGADFEADEDFVTGTGEDKMFHFTNSVTGDTLELNAESVGFIQALNAAFDNMTVSAQQAVNIINSLNENPFGDVLKGFFIDNNLEGATQEEFEQIKAAIGNDVRGYLTEIGREAGLVGEELTNFVNSYVDILTESLQIKWEDVNIPEGLNNSGKLSLRAAQNINNTYNQASFEGSQFGQDYIEGINYMMEQVPEDKMTSVFDAISEIDWSSWEAGEQAVNILHSFGVEVDTTDEKWKNFVNSMRDSMNALPDLETLVEQLQRINEIKDDIELGSIITQEDYELLIKYNNGLSQFFAILSNGQAQFIGDQLDFQQAIEEAYRNSLSEASNSYKDRAEEQLKQYNRILEIIGAEDATTQQDIEDALSQYRKSASGTGDEEGTYNKDIVDKQLEILETLNYDPEKIQGWKDAFEENGNVATSVLNEIGEAVESVANKFLNLGNEAANSAAKAQQALNELALSADSAEEREQLFNTKQVNYSAYGMAAQSAMNEEAWEGLDVEEVQNYASYLEDAFDMTEEGSEEVARSVMKMNRGVEDLADNWEAWGDILKTGNKAGKEASKMSEEYADALGKTKTAVSDLLDVSEDFIDSDFISKPENLELIGKAAEGDAEAIDKLGEALSEDIAFDAIDDFATIFENGFFNAWDGEQFYSNIDDFKNAFSTALNELHNQIASTSLNPGDMIDNDALIAKLNHMVISIGMSVEEANAMYRAMGFTPHFKMIDAVQAETVPLTTTYHSRTVNEYDEYGNPIDWVENEYSTTTQVSGGELTTALPSLTMSTPDGQMPQVPTAEVEDLTYTGGGSLNNYSSTNSGGQPAGGGGKGGGGGKKSTYKKPTPKTRYTNRENQIDRTQQAAEKLEQVEDQLYGKAKLAAMQKKSDLIVQQVKDYKALYDEAVAYREQDMQDLAATQLGQAVPMQIDAEGNILNQEEMDDYMREWKDRIDAIEDEGAKEAEQRAYDISEQAYTYYKEAQEKALEAMKEAVDQLGEWISNEIEKRQYQMEIDIKVSDRQLSLLEFTLEELGSAGWITNWEDGLDNVINQVDSIMAAGESTIDSTESLIELFDKVNNGGLDWSQLDQDMKDMFPEDVWREANENGTLTNDILEAIGDNTETLLDYAGQLTEAWVSAWEKIGEAMDSYLEQLERARAPLDTLSGALDTFISIADSRGWDIGRIEEYNKLLDKQTDILEANLEASQAQYQGTQEALAAMEPVYNDYLEKFENGEITGQQFDVIQEQYYNLVDANADAADQMYSDWDAYVSNLQEKFEVMSEQIYKTWNDKLGNMWNDVLESQEGFDMYKTLQNWYLDDFDKDYGITSLTNQIEDAMDGISDPKRLAEYEAFMEELVAKQEEGYNLSQGELDILNARFQLMQAQDAYEDARNNKNTMRLTRDASGNYSYVYSSDDTSGAEQSVLDAQKNLHDAEKAFQEESESRWYEYALQIISWMKDINWEMYQNDEDYRKQIEEQWKQYTQAMNNAAADTELALTYTEQSFQDTVLGWITGCESMQEANTLYQDSTAELGSEVHQAWVDMDQKIEESASLVIGDSNSMEDAMYDLMGTVDDAMGNMMDTADDLADNMGSNMSQMIEDTASWSDSIIEDINAIIAKYKELYEAQTNVMQNHTGETKNYEWHMDGNTGQWYYGDNNGGYYKSGWMQVDGKWYFFDDQGYLDMGQDRGDGTFWVDNGHYQVDQDGAWIEGTIAEGHTPGDWQSGSDTKNWGANYSDLAGGNWSNTNSGGSSSNSSSGSSSSNQDYSQYLPFDDIPEGSDSNFNYDGDGIRIVNPSFNGSHAGGVDNAHWIGNDAEGWFFGTKDKSGRGNQGSYMDGWLKINGKYYHFDEDGWLDTDFNGQDWHDDFPDEENKSAVWRRYAKGGYTGNQGLKGVDTIPAMLAPGEYVLNHDDTTKILSAVQLLRGLSSGALAAAANAITKLANGSIPQTRQTEQIPVQQDVHIEASFPNVSVASEIEDALNNLVNETIQLIGSQNSRRL